MLPVPACQLRGADRFDEFVQPTLGSRSRILVDQVLRRGLIQSLHRDSEFRLSFFAITSRNSFSNSAELASHSAAKASVVCPAFEILTQSFLCAFGVWHFFT